LGAERINKSQRSGPYLFAPHGGEKGIRTHMYAVCTARRRESRANESPPRHVDSAAAQGKSRTARDRRDADYRWRDLIKHVDCSSAFMANFTLFVSTESYFFSGRDWFMQFTRVLYEIRRVSQLLSLASFENFSLPIYCFYQLYKSKIVILMSTYVS